jgi:hypothetical protein
LLTLCSAVVAGTACWVLSDSLVLALPAAVVASVAPILHVLYARKQRREKLLGQLSDTFELMSRVLRSGQTISQAMQIVADQGSPPISLEFYRCHEQMNLGMTPEAALRDLAVRTDLLEIKIFTVAILVQRQAGGNLSELFDKMGTVVRERFRIRGMIGSLTAQGRMQGVILSALPALGCYGPALRRDRIGRLGGIFFAAGIGLIRGAGNGERIELRNGEMGLHPVRRPQVPPDIRILSHAAAPADAGANGKDGKEKEECKYQNGQRIAEGIHGSVSPYAIDFDAVSQKRCISGDTKAACTVGGGARCAGGGRGA